MKTVEDVVVALRRLVSEGASRRDLAATVTMDGLGFSGCYTNGLGIPMLEDAHPGLKPMREASGGGDGEVVSFTSDEREAIRKAGMDPDELEATRGATNFADWKRRKAAYRQSRGLGGAA